MSSPSPCLRRELATLLLRYTEVEEAYCFVDVARDSEGGGGLLSPNLGASRRFSLVGEIAEVSRQHFGIAGALEVFDDLHVKSSRSWELFSSLAPFYSRENESEESFEPLADHVEVARKSPAVPERAMFFSRKKSLLARIFG